MSGLLELRLAGAGGQGVILAAIILAEAALSESKHVAQSQSYGPEARGGMCKADVVISRSDIDYPQVEEADCLLALTQESLDKYISVVREGGVIVADSRLKIPPNEKRVRIIPAAIIATATESIGRAVTANIVALGALNAAMNIVSEPALEAAVLKYVPKGTEELNIRALKEGEALIQNVAR